MFSELDFLHSHLWDFWCTGRAPVVARCQLGKDEDATSWGWSSWFNMIQLLFLKSTWLLQMAGWWQGTFRRETIWLDRSIWEGHIQMASTRKLRKISSWWADSNDFAVCRNLWYKVPACCVVFHLSGCWCWSIQLDRTSEINIDKAEVPWVCRVSIIVYRWCLCMLHPLVYTM